MGHIPPGVLEEALQEEDNEAEQSDCPIYPKNRLAWRIFNECQRHWDCYPMGGLKNINRHALMDYMNLWGLKRTRQLQLLHQIKWIENAVLQAQLANKETKSS